MFVEDPDCSLSGTSAGIQLNQELLTSNRFGLFPDDSCVHRQTLETLKKPAIGLVVPPYETRTSPTTGSQLIEPPVVTDPERHVRLDARRTRPTQCRPHLQTRGETGGKCCDGGSTNFYGALFCLCQLVAESDIETW